MNNKKDSGKANNNYRQGFQIALIIAVTGILLEWITRGKGVALPSWPLNLFVGLSFAFILVFIHIYYSDVKVVRWLSRVPASISAIALFTLLTLIMGLTRQYDPEASAFMKYTGLSHIRTSYIFLLSGMYLLTTLGLVIIRRITPLNYKNFGFALNHLGLWIIVLAGSLGAGDLLRLNMYVNEGESVWYASKNRKQLYQLPFTVKLIDFDIKEFPPKLAYIETREMRFPDEEIENNLTMIEEGLAVNIAGWKINVEDFMQASRQDSLGNYYPSSDTSAVPSAKIKAVHTSTGTIREGWISSGGIMKTPEFLRLDERHSLAMTRPEAREYSSLLEIKNKEGDIDTTRLVVNEPVEVDGYKLYQLSYDERMGKWSQLSIIEVIRDPWLPLIYLGIFMVIGGALYLFTIGKSPKEEKNGLD